MLPLPFPLSCLTPGLEPGLFLDGVTVGDTLGLPGLNSASLKAKDAS